jgi:crossover junction endodeoxyribonuclease RusA
MPPSANRYWRHNRGIIHRSKEAEAYINNVGVFCVAAGVRPTADPVRVSVEIYRPARRGDLDNTLKVLLDSLRGYAFIDDAQVVEIHAYRHEDKANPRAVVTVESAAYPDKEAQSGQR